MIGKLSCLVVSTLAVYPTGPTDYGWNGGCMTLPADRWSTGVVSQWRNANRPNSKSWHGEQMKIYLDMHDERDEGATKYDDFAYVDDTYFELVFDVNLLNLGATFNPFYPVQLGQTFTKADGTTATQGIWYSTEGCCTLHIEVDDKEQGRDLMPGSESNQYMEWQWTNHPGTWFTYADHVIEVRMCQHPATTNNGYDTWSAGPSIVDPTHVVLDCSTDFRWITHWDGQSGCCNAVDAPYVTRTGQIAIDGDFGPLNQGDFFEVALDGELFDIVEINGGNFVNIENIQENAWRFFVDTDAFNGQSRSIEKGGGGTGIFANYQLYFIGANSFVKPQCKWIQLCRTPTAETTTPAAPTTTAAPPCSTDPCNALWGTCVVVTDSNGVDHEDCQCTADYQGEQCQDYCEMNDNEKVDIAFVINASGDNSGGIDTQVIDFIRDVTDMFNTNNNARVTIHTCGGTSTHNPLINPVQHMTTEDIQSTVSSQLPSIFDGNTANECATAIFQAEAAFDVTDDIADVMFVISDGRDDDMTAVESAINSANANHITTIAIGYPQGGASDFAGLAKLAGGQPTQLFNAGTSDPITGNVPMNLVFDLVCNAQPPPGPCDNNGGCVNGVCSEDVAPDGSRYPDCQCDTGYQGTNCDVPCALPGPDDRVDVVFLLDFSGPNHNWQVDPQNKDIVDSTIRDFDTRFKMKFSVLNFASTVTEVITPVQFISAEHSDSLIWGQSWPSPDDPVTDTALGINTAMQQFDTTDTIPDILVIVTDGHVSDVAALQTEMDAVTAAGVETYVIGFGQDGTSDAANMLIMAQGNADQMVNAGTSDEIGWAGPTRAAIQEGVFEAICQAELVTTTTPVSTASTITPPNLVNELEAGTCYSGNWTKWFDVDNPGDGDDSELFTEHLLAGNLECAEVSAIQVRDTNNPDGLQATDNLILDAQNGMLCTEADQDDALCEDYEIRFCCESCCPLLNISGDPELTDYYEDYPGLYELTDEVFNDAIVYRQISGYDAAGVVIYGQGVVYYWMDVGWLLGPNTFTYSYYSDGIGEKCPQFAPKNWTNEVFGTQLTVECLPVYPSCNDVECVENACCIMSDDGPVCTCEDGYTLYEDGSCLKESPDDTFSDGFCDTTGANGPAMVWSDWSSIDSPNFGLGDYETLERYPQNQICSSPSAIEAQRITPGTGVNQVVHISKEIGFWCAHSEQSGGTCEDFEVRFCCPKYEAGDTMKCDTGDGYAWTKWNSADSPATGAGDWETINYFGERDVCSSPVAVKAQPVAGSSGSDAVTHIDPAKGFWCINEEQGGTDDCMDFEVQFCCPKPVTDDLGMTYIMDGTCDDPTYGWSQYLNSDSPLTDDGDWETLGRFSRKYTCANPSGIQARTNETSGFDRVHLNVESGFWCLNSEQAGGQCADFEVRFCCPQYKTADCTAPGSSWTGWYNDEWDKKNEKIWVSSREEREELQMYGDGAACSAPTASEIRPRPTGSVSFQTTMWEYSTHLVDHLSPTGYLCINEEQGSDENGDPYKCIDIEIRFCCEQTHIDGDCDQEGYEWTRYYDSDAFMNDGGDYELISSFSADQVCGNPAAVQARLQQTPNLPSYEFTHASKDLGFYCVDSEQDDGKCDNYEVRFCCPKYQVGECNLQGYAWTNWIDNDDPTDLGDMENFSSLQPNTACRNPVAIKAKDNNAHFLDNTSDQVTHLDMSGFYCFNHEQNNGLPCSDFSVSYCCPTDEETLTCGSAGVCPENEWCLETAIGPQCFCGDDDFNVDWDEDDYVEYEDGTCLHNNSSDVACDGVECTLEVGSCDTYGYAWTTLSSVSDPTTDSGDFEFIHAHPRGCDAPSGVRASAADDGSSTWPVHLNLDLGFWCVNSEQSDGQCADFSVQFCCPTTATGDCSADGYKWSEYVNNDLPDGIGDWESLPATVCANPIAVEASLSANATEAITQRIHVDNNKGVWCLNSENGGSCDDYAIRMCCPEFQEGECKTHGYTYGSWLDSDDPDGQGDLELNTNHGSHLVCDAPEAITSRQVNETEPASNATTRISVSEGFVCLNDAFNTCNDFEVSYCCPKWAAGNVHCNVQGYAWTEWINQDDPTSHSGDWETRTSYGERMVCSNPIGVQATPLDENAGSTEVTHIDANLGFWCVNEEQNNGQDCADFAVRFCCPQYQIGDDVSCDTEGHEWTDWLDRDDPTGDGDYETIGDYALENSCSNPTAIDARARSSGSTAVTHIDLAYGFWCNNDEQSVESGGCADFEVRFCCPKKAEKQCNADGYRWTVWMDRDDPNQGTGDWENRDGFPANVVCQTPLAVQAQVKSGSDGSTEVTHFDNEQGFWCINDEQPKDRECADFEVRFCCPDEYFDPCVAQNLTCGLNEHEVFQILADGSEQCSCECDEGYLPDGLGVCELDVSCEGYATLTTCPDFDSCVNKNGFATVVSRQLCNDTVCESCTFDCNSAGGNNDGVEIQCSDPNAYPALNGGDKGTIACICDGKNPCTWQSEDFLGDITEEDLCITDSECPISVWTDYYGLIDVTKERFLTDLDHTDTNFNTKQSDLYDSGMTEILGRIETASFAGLPALSAADWSQGHYLVIVWEADMRETVDVCPYGDYYDRVESDFGDGDVEVFETFVDPFVLRDSNGRDLSTGMDVVLNIRHDYDLDAEDITDLLKFRIAIVPKQWRDAYGDMTKKTAQEVADCLNQVLDSTAKLNGQTRRTTRRLEVSHSEVRQAPVSKWMKRVQSGSKTFRKPSQKGQTWRQRNQAKQAIAATVRS